MARRAGASRHRLAARWRASVAATVEEVFTRTRTVIVMLLNEAVTDQVLHRSTPRFTDLAADHLIMSMGSTAPDYSETWLPTSTLPRPLRRSPGFRLAKAAEAWQFVALLGGDAQTAADVRRLLAPMCR